MQTLLSKSLQEEVVFKFERKWDGENISNHKNGNVNYYHTFPGQCNWSPHALLYHQRLSRCSKLQSDNRYALLMEN